MSNEDDKENTTSSGFSEKQKNYLQGYALGADVARTVRGLPVISDSGRNSGEVVQVGPAGAQVVGPDAILHGAVAKTEADGGKLCNEEKAKRDNNPLDLE